MTERFEKTPLDRLDAVWADKETETERQLEAAGIDATTQEELATRLSFIQAVRAAQFEDLDRVKEELASADPALGEKFQEFIQSEEFASAREEAGFLVPPEHGPEKDQEAESLEERERREQKERILVALHPYFKERNRDTPLHLEMAQKIERLKELCQELVPYAERAGEKGLFILHGRGTEVRMKFDGREPYFTFKKENNSEGWDYAYDFVKGSSVGKEFAEDKKFQGLGEEIKKLTEDLRALQEKLQQERQKLLRETMVALGYGELLSSGRWGGAEKELFNTEGHENFLFTEFPNYKDIRIGDQTVKWNGTHDDLIKQIAGGKFGITEVDLRQLSRIEWSAEDREKLDRLVRAADTYEANLRKNVPLSGPRNEFTQAEFELWLSMDKSSYIRSSYKKLELPPQHQERVVQEIKSVGRVE